jgi:hypothetical protein
MPYLEAPARRHASARSGRWRGAPRRPTPMTAWRSRPPAAPPPPQRSARSPARRGRGAGAGTPAQRRRRRGPPYRRAHREAAARRALLSGRRRAPRHGASGHDTRPPRNPAPRRSTATPPTRPVPLQRLAVSWVRGSPGGRSRRAPACRRRRRAAARSTVAPRPSAELPEGAGRGPWEGPVALPEQRHREPDDQDRGDPWLAGGAFDLRDDQTDPAGLVRQGPLICHEESGPREQDAGHHPPLDPSRERRRDVPDHEGHAHRG